MLLYEASSITSYINHAYKLRGRVVFAVAHGVAASALLCYLTKPRPHKVASWLLCETRYDVMSVSQQCSAVSIIVLHGDEMQSRNLLLHIGVQVINGSTCDDTCGWHAG